MKKCYVHIGMQKTGSSSIQDSFKKGLSDDDFLYAPFSTANHGLIIYSLFEPEALKHRAHIKVGRGEKELEKFNAENKAILVDAIEMSIANNLIISGEMIINMTRGGLKNLKTFLEMYFDEIIIVAYVRPPSSLISSAFQQIVKVPPLLVSQLNIKNSYIEYKRRFDKFDDVFGIDNVFLWLYDEENFFRGDVVLDFAHRLGIDSSSFNVVKFNEGISKNALSLLYIYRKFGPGYGRGATSIRENNQLVNKISQISGEKLKLSAKLVNSILDENTQDVEWFKLRMGVNIDSFLQEGAGNISSENELCRPDDYSVINLINMIDPQLIPCGVKGQNPAEIAMLVHALRLQLSGEIKNVNAKPKGDVIKVESGFSFLTGGGHKVLDYFSGIRSVSDTSVKNFSENIKDRSEFCSARGISFRHFVFPDKLYSLRNIVSSDIISLYKNYYEFEAKEKGVSDFIKYLEFDVSEAESFYSRTDTHLNMYGNLQLLSEMDDLDKRDVAEYCAKIKSNLIFKSSILDLGDKFEPVVSESYVVSGFRVDSVTRYSNGIKSGNYGIMDLMINDAALYDKRVVLFGDSFLRAMLPSFSYFYREIVFCRTRFFHAEVINACSPDLVYTGNAERYFSNVEKDSDRVNFFVIPLVDGKDVSPDIGFSEAFCRIFDVNKVGF